MQAHEDNTRTDPAAPTEKDRAGIDARALARQLTRIEREEPDAVTAAFASARRFGRLAHVIGLTGPPGVGKSTVVDQLVQNVRVGARRVGVVAVDPSSSQTGGAILGDRVRMLASHRDRGVFVRSMATRGQMGGLATAAPAAVCALIGAGCDVVLVETVGVGQSETAVMQLVDTTVLVLSPGAGDSVQALKAGVLEIADLFVVNKADLGGAGQLVAQLRAAQDTAGHTSGWHPPLLKAAAVRGEGITEIIAALGDHADHLDRKHHRDQRHRRLARQVVRDVALRQLTAALDDPSSPTQTRLGEVADRVAGGQLAPGHASSQLLSALGDDAPPPGA